MNAMSSRRTYVAPRIFPGEKRASDGIVLMISFLPVVVGAVVGAPVMLGIGMAAFLGAVIHEAASWLDGERENAFPTESRAMIDAALLD